MFDRMLQSCTATVSPNAKDRNMVFHPGNMRFLSCHWLTALILLALASCLVSPAAAQELPNSPARLELPAGLVGGPQAWTSPEGLRSTIQVMLLLTVLSMAPAVLLMTTCFIRILVVLGLLRQALATQQLPPSQVITSVALFMTLLVMTPTLETSLRRWHRALHPQRDHARPGLGTRHGPRPPVHE